MKFRPVLLIAVSVFTFGCSSRESQEHGHHHENGAHLHKGEDHSHNHKEQHNEQEEFTVGKDTTFSNDYHEPGEEHEH